MVRIGFQGFGCGGQVEGLGIKVQGGGGGGVSETC